jgi:hypothetical protein
VFFVKCVGHYAYEEYRDAIDQAALGRAFVAGIPVLLDISESTTELPRLEDYARRAACLSALAAPNTALVVAVLTSEARIAIALRGINVMAKHGIQACAFTDFGTAAAWLGVAPVTYACAR